MSNGPTKRYAYGMDWGNWNIGFSVRKIKRYKISVLTITLLPLTVYVTLRKYEEEDI